MHEDFEEFLSEIRPRLHRYCARMTGSAVDGEDIVQDSMIKAFNALPEVGLVDNPEGWLFRIAHNTALDFLRRRAREPATVSEKVFDMIAAPDSHHWRHEVAATSIRTFMRLPAQQRSAVILKDVLGHSLEEISSITGMSQPAAKSALQRGRVSLREFANDPEDIVLPTLSQMMQERLIEYVDGFRFGDFDSVRALLADDVKLDLVAKLHKQGKGEVGEYYDRYAAVDRWAYAAGVVDGGPAMLVYERKVSLQTPAYFVALEFDGDRIVSVHDFLYARYAMDGIEVQVIDQPSSKAEPST